MSRKNDFIQKVYDLNQETNAHMIKETQNLDSSHEHFYFSEFQFLKHDLSQRNA